jgi:hypothetical protein
MVFFSMHRSHTEFLFCRACLFSPVYPDNIRGKKVQTTTKMIFRIQFGYNLICNLLNYKVI